MVFIVALAKSNIDVMLRVLNPKLPMRPGIVRIETKLTSPMARLILANSITLTPGTFVVDIKENLLYIHWIEVCCEDDPQQLAQEISGQFEKILLKIYE
jgi:multicomponent Na+:H+ antiporter subunit E